MAWYDHYKQEKILVQQGDGHNKFWAAYVDEKTNIAHVRWGRIRRLLLTHGIDAEIIGHLDVSADPADRSAKIATWVKENRPDKYLVIDDLPIEGHPIIRPNPALGLQEPDIVEAIKILA